MAAALEPWLRRVIQSAKPYFSDKIEAGGFWDESIKASLKSVRFAIVCCTPENIAAPWLNYEAGAMAERMEGGTVPWLLDAKPQALQSSPLSRLMARTADKAGTLSVVQTLNLALGSPVGEQVLSETFDDAWPKLEQKLKSIPEPETKPPERTERDMLEEVVGLCRQLASGGTALPVSAPASLVREMVDQAAYEYISERPSLLRDPDFLDDLAIDAYKIAKVSARKRGQLTSDSVKKIVSALAEARQLELTTPKL